MTVDMATSGAEITKLQEDETVANKKNSELAQDLAKFSSLALISSEASASGFLKPTTTLYVSGSSGVAARLP